VTPTRPVVRVLSAIGACALPAALVTIGATDPGPEPHRTVHRGEMAAANHDPVRFLPPTTAATIVEPAEAVPVTPTTGRPQRAPRTSRPSAVPVAAGRGCSFAGPTPPDYIRQRESGGDYTARNPSSTASGAWQMLDTTWHAMGGTGSAANASPAEQDCRAAMLWAQSGSSPWAATR